MRDWRIVEGGPRFDEAMRIEVAPDATLLVSGVEGASTGSRRAGTFQWRISTDGRVLSRRAASDLGFASIDAVILGEKLESFYGRKIHFHKFLAQAMQSGAEDLEVGKLAEFLETELNT